MLLNLNYQMPECRDVFILNYVKHYFNRLTTGYPGASACGNGKVTSQIGIRPVMNRGVPERNPVFFSVIILYRIH